MTAMKDQVSELMVNQKHMLEALKYFNERIDDIIEKAIRLKTYLRVKL